MFFARRFPPRLPRVRRDGVAARGRHVDDERVGSAGGFDERRVDLRPHRPAADDDDRPFRRSDLDRAGGEGRALNGAPSFRCRRGLGRSLCLK